MTFALDTFWTAEADEHLNVAQTTFAILKDDFAHLLKISTASIRNGGKIIFFGNGGSAADAQHLATELTIRYIKDRAAISAIALTTDSSALTAAGNDLGFDHIFARQIAAIGRAGDVAIGISTSGNSANIIKALETAKDMKIHTTGLSGRDGGTMAALCDPCLIVPSDTTARIQEMHIWLGHLLCGALEQELGLI